MGTGCFRAGLEAPSLEKTGVRMPGKPSKSKVFRMLAMHWGLRYRPPLRSLFHCACNVIASFLFSPVLEINMNVILIANGMRQSSYETSEGRTPQPYGQLPLEKGSSQRSILQSFCLDQTGQVEGYDSKRRGSFLPSTFHPRPSTVSPARGSAEF
jgi:hypothetical protein